MFTEVIQNSVIDLMMKGRIRFAAGSSLTLSEDRLDTMYEHIATSANASCCARRKSPTTRR